MYRYCIGISGRYMEKNLDLIACTPARHRRFSRKCSWEASKETRARGLVRRPALSRVFRGWFSVQASLKSVCVCQPPLLFQRDQINSLRNGRDYGLKQIENAFRDPEDGFWEKNSSEDIVGNVKYTRNSRPVWFSCN